MTEAKSGNGGLAHEDGSEVCACGAVRDWPEVWEGCGAVLVFGSLSANPVSHAPARLGGCFEVTHVLAAEGLQARSK